MPNRLIDATLGAVLAGAAPLLIGALIPERSPAQTRAENPRFEVASVKRNLTCGTRRGGRTPGAPGRLNQECMTVKGLILTAYGIWANGLTNSYRLPEITGGPGWVDSDTYDIAAKADNAAPFPQMAGPMLRTLLEDRFKLKLHREVKEAPVYFLTVAKNGPKMPAAKEGSCVPIDPNHPPPQNSTVGQALPRYCAPGFQTKGSTMTVTSRGGTMAQLCDALLSRIVGRPVIDKTGLSGRYEFEIEFVSPQPGASMLPGDSSGAPPPSEMASIFSVLQSQLGLKLEPGKGTVEALIIDRVERPAEN
jgi:uncharacterized protein (TIGR03435 family)